MMAIQKHLKWYCLYRYFVIFVRFVREGKAGLALRISYPCVNKLSMIFLCHLHFVAHRCECVSLSFYSLAGNTVMNLF